MRTINEIIIAVKDCEPATDEELRMCIAALSGIEYFSNKNLEDLTVAITESKSLLIDLRVRESKHWLETRFAVFKKDPVKWLGPGNTPGHPEQVARMAMSKKIFKAATGEDL